MSSISKYLWITVLTLTLGLFCTIRDDNGNPVVTNTTNPSDTVTVTTTPALLASPDSIYVRLKDTLGIQVTVLADSSMKDSVTPLPYAPVRATVSSGRLIRDSLSSDRNGRCRFLFTDTVTGSIDMTIKCNGVSVSIHFDVSNAPDQIQKLISVYPEKSVALANGKDSTLITCTVMNSNHNPIAGECVQFISTAGIIIGSSTACGNGKSITSSAGVATAYLISSNINDTAYIMAYLVSDRTLSDETEVAFSGVSIKSATSKNNLVIGDTTVITATVLNGSGNPVARAPVFFSMKSSVSNLQILSADSVTNYEGTAVARVRANSNGFGILSVISSGTSTNLQLNVSTLFLTLTVDHPVWQTRSADSVTVVATFTNASRSPLPGRIVRLNKTFKTESGSDTIDSVSHWTDSDGKSTFKIASLTYEGTINLELIGYDNVEGYASANTAIQFVTNRIMTIRAPTFLAADGSSKGIVTVNIKSENGNPVVNDVIQFSTTIGSITAEAATDTNGKATAYITSERIENTAHITARLKSDPQKYYDSINVTFAGIQISAGAQPPSIRNNNKDTTVISVKLTDAATNPIAGEDIFFLTNHNKETSIYFTDIYFSDKITNNAGEAKCYIRGNRTGKDTIYITAANKTDSIVLNYSSHILVIDTLPGQSLIADGKDSTTFEVTYLLGDSATPIPNANVEMSYTVGKSTLDSTIFVGTFTTNASGKFRFSVKNPTFAVPATISAMLKTTTEMTTQNMKINFRAKKVYKIKLTGTSEVINVNGDKCTIYAVAYDSLGNRVQGARIAFNLLRGPSGGEYLDPPYATTGEDGTAITTFVSGKTPSTFRQVLISAGDFNTVKSDTVKFTIVGPPKYITVRTNLEEGENPKDGTYLLPCAAIVTDVNGNPVADGTEVTFSVQVSGLVYSKFTYKFDDYTTSTYCYPELDTLYYILPFEDLNENFKLDIDEDDNNDGFANRGENINGDTIYDRGPSYLDINKNGKRDFNFNTMSVEKVNPCGSGTVFGDLNDNGYWDPIEPLTNSNYINAYYRLLSDSAFYKYYGFNSGSLSSSDSTDLALLFQLDAEYKALPGYSIDKFGQELGFDMDCNWNGICDPNTAVSITRTVQTTNGKATNKILYGQTDAGIIRVKIWAESQGVRTLTPEQIILPIVSSEED